MKPVLAEILKLRGSTSWAVVVLLSVVSVVSVCIFVRPDGWRLLWIRSVDWASSFWIVFLLIPLAFLIRTDMPGPLKALGILEVGVFTCLYTWAVSTMPIWLELQGLLCVSDRIKRVVG